MQVAIKKKYPIIKKSTILIVDDESGNMVIVADILKQQGADVISIKHSYNVLYSTQYRNVDIFVLNINSPLYDAAVKVRQMRKMVGGDIPFMLICEPVEAQKILDIIDLCPVGYINMHDSPEQIAARFAIALTPKEFSIQHTLLKRLLMKAIKTFVKGKKLEIIQYIIEHSNEQYIFYGSYGLIAEHLQISKPTVVNLFTQLIDAGLVTRVRNKTYRLNIDEYRKVII